MAMAISGGIDSDGTLEKLLKPEFSFDSNGNPRFFIGTKDTLNAKAPYWYVLNYGVSYKTGQPYIPPVNIGYFEGSNWVHTGEHQNGRDTRLMEPGNPITPIPYIDLANNYIARELAAL